MGRFILKQGVAVITGAGSGIGAALADGLAARGCHLALTDRKPDSLHETAERARRAGVRVTEHVFDVADAVAIAGLPAQVEVVHGGVTVLINNAGVALGGSFEQITLEDIKWLMNINFWGVVRMSKAFMPLLRRAPMAQLVNISSIYGVIAPAGQTAYSASKFAVRGFSESLRHELWDEKSTVGVTVVHPGGVRTNIAKDARTSDVATQEQIERATKRFDRLLRMPPPIAAEKIIRGIERRAPRVLIGSDAAGCSLLQKLMPEHYWRVLRRAAQ
jgi:short-subunit dehydrogenase